MIGLLHLAHAKQAEHQNASSACKPSSPTTLEHLWQWCVSAATESPLPSAVCVQRTDCCSVRLSHESSTKKSTSPYWKSAPRCHVQTSCIDLQCMRRCRKRSSTASELSSSVWKRRSSTCLSPSGSVNGHSDAAGMLRVSAGAKSALGDSGAADATAAGDVSLGSCSSRLTCCSSVTSHGRLASA